MCSSSFTGRQGGTSTSLFQVPSDIRSLEKDEAEFHPLHMVWVLTAGTKGNPMPRMHWLID